MAVTIQLSFLLRDYCGGIADFKLDATSVRNALEVIEKQHPALYRSVCDETGAVRKHVNIFVNDHNTRDAAGIESKLTSGDVVTILQAVSGG
ncbi:MAG: MoaD/ThiS family protein [Planctomycetota bacterium]|nr:MoaD/ThiS family protein [Planctomycetota bacterium]